MSVTRLQDLRLLTSVGKIDLGLDALRAVGKDREDDKDDKDIENDKFVKDDRQG